MFRVPEKIPRSCLLSLFCLTLLWTRLYLQFHAVFISYADIILVRCMKPWTPFYYLYRHPEWVVGNRSRDLDPGVQFGTPARGEIPSAPLHIPRHIIRNCRRKNTCAPYLPRQLKLHAGNILHLSFHLPRTSIKPTRKALTWACE